MNELHPPPSDQRERWVSSLILPGYRDLRSSLLAELAEYLGNPIEAVEARCRSAGNQLAEEWVHASPLSPEDVESFFRDIDHYIYDLTWRQGRVADETGLIHVQALESARCHHARNALDFGSGIGSLGILLAQHGLDATMVEINPRINDYAKWRFERRNLEGTFVDVGTAVLPVDRFDFVAAIDVLEQVARLDDTLLALTRALRHGGTLFIHLSRGQASTRLRHLKNGAVDLIKILSSFGLWLEGGKATTLVFRKGNAPCYRLKSGFDLIPESDGGALVSRVPFAVTRLNASAFRILSRLASAPDASNINAGSRRHSTLEAVAFIEDIASRGIISKTIPPLERWPSFSIIVPARNRPDHLLACIESLQKLDYPQGLVEILIVDDASDPPLMHTVEGLPVRVFRQEVNIGQSAARNLAAREAKGDLLAFTDDDCVVDPGWLKALATWLDVSRIEVVGGRVKAMPSDSSLSAYEAVRSPLDMGSAGSPVGPRRTVTYLPSCNMAMWRRTFLELGGFDAEMRLGEDVDLTWRALAAGMLAHYVPEAEVLHHHRTRLGDFLHRRLHYGSSEAELSRHPEGRRGMRIPIIVTNLLVALLAFPISMDTSMGLVILAVTLFLVGLSRKALLLRKKTLRFPLQRIMSAALDEQWAGLYHLSANLLRYYSLPLLALGVIWPAFLGVVLIVFMTPPLVEYVRHRPRLDLPRFTLLYWSEMLAYQVGVWWGCAKRRTLDPLLPRVSLGW